MCIDPLSLGAIGSFIASNVGTVASVASGLVGAYATVQNSRAQAKALEAQSAQEAEAARDALIQGEEESDRRRRAGAIQAGEQRAALAANGIDVEGEIALDILDDNQTLIEEDAFAIRENSRRAAKGFAQRSANSSTQASNARSQGTFGAISTVLTTASKVGSKFAKYTPQAQNSDPWRNLRGAY